MDYEDELVFLSSIIFGLVALLALFSKHSFERKRLFIFSLLSILGFGVGLATFSTQFLAEGVQHLVLVWLLFSAPLMAHLLWYKIFGAEVKNDKS